MGNQAGIIRKIIDRSLLSDWIVPVSVVSSAAPKVRISNWQDVLLHKYRKAFRIFCWLWNLLNSPAVLLLTFPQNVKAIRSLQLPHVSLDAGRRQATCVVYTRFIHHGVGVSFSINSGNIVSNIPKERNRLNLLSTDNWKQRYSYTIYELIMTYVIAMVWQEHLQP